jgi:uncharacterized protein YjbJ (UPF0337 family)
LKTGVESCPVLDPGLTRRRKLGLHAKDPKEDQTMDKDIFEGNWKQIRGEAKSWWGKLTDDDLDRVTGKAEVLEGLLQEKYGYTRERAADEIDKHVTQYVTTMKTKTVPDLRKMTEKVPEPHLS